MIPSAQQVSRCRKANRLGAGEGYRCTIISPGGLGWDDSTGLTPIMASRWGLYMTIWDDD